MILTSSWQTLHQWTQSPLRGRPSLGTHLGPEVALEEPRRRVPLLTVHVVGILGGFHRSPSLRIRVGYRAVQHLVVGCQVLGQRAEEAPVWSLHGTRKTSDQLSLAQYAN